MTLGTFFKWFVKKRGRTLRPFWYWEHCVICNVVSNGLCRPVVNVLSGAHRDGAGGDHEALVHRVVACTVKVLDVLYHVALGELQFLGGRLVVALQELYRTVAALEVVEHPLGKAGVRRGLYRKLYASASGYGRWSSGCVSFLEKIVATVQHVVLSSTYV